MLSLFSPKSRYFYFLIFILVLTLLVLDSSKIYSDDNNPPNIPTFIAPPNNTWIDYDPIFKAQVSDPDNENVRAVFHVIGYGTYAGTWVESGGISEWGPVSAEALIKACPENGNKGACRWRAYTEDAREGKSGWYGYWMVKIDLGCKCSSGDCCSDGCTFDSSSTVCDTETEYQCPSADCGGDCQSRTKNQYCSGSAADCAGSLGSWSGWETEEPCDDDELCYTTSPYCRWDLSCTCECSGGDCCSDGCTFDSSLEECDSGYNYDCLDTECGGNAERQSWTKYCSGSSAGCDGSTSPDSPETIPCNATERCSDGSCVYDPNCEPPDCPSGPCCSSDGNFKSSSEECDSGYNYQCSGAGCGDDYQKMSWTQYCSGSSTGCDGSTEYGAWETEEPCDDTKLCYATSPHCVGDPSCAPCECSSGDCCDGCNFESSSTVCEPGAEEQFQCSIADCGGDYQKRTKDKYCSGSAADCTGSLGSWSGWSTVEYCDDTERCYTTFPYCRGDSCTPTPEPPPEPISGGLVPCGRPGYPPCQLCHFFILARNIINFLLKTVLILAPLFIAFGGIQILTAGGSAEQVNKGKKAIYYAIIGVVIAFGAWFIINEVMVLLANPEAFPWPWNEIKCP